MSFVGMMVNQNGIVAFSDSRSTVRDQCGQSVVRSDQVKKLFLHPNFVIATFATDRIMPQNGMLVNLQDIMYGIIRNSPESFRFADIIPEIREKLQGHFTAWPNSVTGFVVGEKEAAGCFRSYTCTLDKTGWHQGKYSYLPELHVAGDLSLFNQSCIVLPTWSIDEMQRRAEMLVRAVMDLHGAVLEYSTVGGEVQIQVLR